MTESKYLKFFTDNRDWLVQNGELVGDMLLVERVTFPERKIGSIIIADAQKSQFNAIASDEPRFYRVLLVGAGYYDDETKESVPLDIEQGDIILTGSVSVKLFSRLPTIEDTTSDIIGVTRHGDIQWRWKGEASFNEFLSKLNESVKAQVQPK